MAGKLGRLRTAPSFQVPKLTDYMSDPFPYVSPTSTFDGTSGVASSLGMLGNDVWGDCVIAAYIHTCMLNAWLAGEQPAGNVTDTTVWPTDVGAITAYLTLTGSPDPTNHDYSQQQQYDTGLNMAEAALALTKMSIGPLKPLAGFASVSDFGEEYEGAMQAFGTVWTGITVSSEMITEFDNNEPWGSTASDWEGGHCVPHAYRDPNFGKCVTWAKEQEFTWPNWRVTREEAYVLLTEEQLAASKFFDGVKLKADITALRGTL